MYPDAGADEADVIEQLAQLQREYRASLQPRVVSARADADGANLGMYLPAGGLAGLALRLLAAV
jgi:hypothetical protein